MSKEEPHSLLMVSHLSPLPITDSSILETPDVLKALCVAHRHLAELKGLCESLPNPPILIDMLSIQEAKDSSAIENTPTTHGELYSTAGRNDHAVSPAAKEVHDCVAALRSGFEAMSNTGLIQLQTIRNVQGELEQHQAGLRQIPRAKLTGGSTYAPPQTAKEVKALMDNLIDFIHADDSLDPLLRMTIVHYQFESIQPFYDGNGRTGRILILLMLIRDGLLDLPVLYPSRYIATHQTEFHRLLRSVREENRWDRWAIFLLRGVAITARNGTSAIRKIRELMMRYKHEIRDQLPKIYRQELVNTLFRHPYSKIEFVEHELGVSRITAAKYLDQLAMKGFVRKQKVGRTNLFINEPLFDLLTDIESSG